MRINAIGLKEKLLYGTTFYSKQFFYAAITFDFWLTVERSQLIGAMIFIDGTMR